MSSKPQQHLDMTAVDDLNWSEAGRGVLARWVFGLIVLASLVLVVLHFSDLEELVSLARSARPEWLLLGLLAQAATYFCAGGVWRETLKWSAANCP